MNDTTTLILIIAISLIVLIAVFFILREIFCWYWKINERIELAKRQNFLIELLLKHFTGEIPVGKSDQSHLRGNMESEINIRLIDQEKYSFLSTEEKVEADRFIAYGLKSGEKVVINIADRRIDRLDKNEWNQIQKNKEQGNWIIIAENEIQ